jgi:hypothetical protein
VELGLQEIDRARPIADPQDTGLLKGRVAIARAAAKEQQQAAQQQQPQQQRGDS